MAGSSVKGLKDLLIATRPATRQGDGASGEAPIRRTQ